MNIFLLDSDLATSAKYSVDIHLNKLIIEHVQMLSAAVRRPDTSLPTIVLESGGEVGPGGIDAGYKLGRSHRGHGCTLWASRSLTNWLYLREYTYALEAERQYRYQHNSEHASISVMKSLPLPNLADLGFTSPYLAVPDHCLSPSHVETYRNYYVRCKWHLAKWTRRTIPDWYLDRLGKTMCEFPVLYDWMNASRDNIDFPDPVRF